MDSFGKILLVVSNVGFLLPFWACYKAKKPVGAFFFLLLSVISSLYHGCKWGYVDQLGYGGHCLIDVTYEMFYAFDFFCSQMTIAIFVGFFIYPKFPMVDLEEEYLENITAHLESCSSPMDSNRFEIKPEIAKDSSAENHQNFQIFILKNGVKENVFSRRDLDVFYARSKNGGHFFLQKDAATSVVMCCEKCNGVICVEKRDKNDFGAKVGAFSKRYRATTTFDECENGASGITLGRKFYKSEIGIFVEVSKNSKIFLSRCETFYVLYHALGLSCAISLAGTSILYISLPILLFNVLFVGWLLLGSILSERFKKNRNLNFIAKTKTVCPFSQTPLGCNVVKSLSWNCAYKNSTKNGALENFIENNKILYLSLALTVGIVAVILFSVQDVLPGEYYPWTHSLWHILGGLAFYLLLDRVL